MIHRAATPRNDIGTSASSGAGTPIRLDVREPAASERSVVGYGVGTLFVPRIPSSPLRRPPATATRRRRHRCHRHLVAALVAACATLSGVGVAAVSTHAAPAESSGALPSSHRSTPALAWASLHSAEARGAALGRLLAHRLVRTGVPVPVTEVSDTGAALGLFRPQTWVLQLSVSALSEVPSRTSGEIAALAGAAHHEARHAEQWFRMAQLRARQGQSTAAIAAAMSLPPHVADAAVNVVPSGTVVDVDAQRWWDSIYGSGNGHRNRVLSDLHSAKTAYNDAVRHYRDHPSAEAAHGLTQAKNGLQPVYAEYRALPEELDAFRVQDQFIQSAKPHPQRAAA